MMLPPEIIARIADFLQEKDYGRFLQTNKNIYESIQYYKRYFYPMTQEQEEAFHQLFTNNLNIHLSSSPQMGTDIILVNYIRYYLKENSQGRILITCTERNYLRWKGLLSALKEHNIYFPREVNISRCKDPNIILFPSESINRLKRYSPTLIIHENEWILPIFEENTLTKVIQTSYIEEVRENIFSIRIPSFSSHSYYYISPNFKPIMSEIRKENKKIIFFPLDSLSAWVLDLIGLYKRKCFRYERGDKELFNVADEGVLIYDLKTFNIPIHAGSSVVVVQLDGNDQMSKYASSSLIYSSSSIGKLIYLKTPRR